MTNNNDKKPVKDDALKIEGTLDDVLNVSIPTPKEDKKDE
jgi:hypothetical protein